MAIKIEMLRCFAVVARSGNLVDAADKLGRTPSAVSMMLKQFEAHLGAPLFASERKSKLTALGRFALREASRELDHFDRATSAIESFARSESGFVRVAAVPSVAKAILPDVVRDYLCDRPGVHVDIRDMDSVGVLRELERERVELGLATGENAGFEREELFSDAFGVVCRADHPLASESAPIEWSALAPWPFIANAICGRIADETFQGIFDRSQLMARNTSSILAFVQAGVGISVLPRLSITNDDTGLVFLPVADPTARRRVDIIRRANDALSPAAQSFEVAVRHAAREITASW